MSPNAHHTTRDHINDLITPEMVQATFNTTDLVISIRPFMRHQPNYPHSMFPRSGDGPLGYFQWVIRLLNPSNNVRYSMRVSGHTFGTCDYMKNGRENTLHFLGQSVAWRRCATEEERLALYAQARPLVD